MFLGAVYIREEDPYRKRNNFTLGLHAEILVRVVPKYRRFEKELKMMGDKNKHPVWALPLFLRALIITFLQNYDNNTLVVTLNEMACFVPSTRILLVKAVYMELGSSHLLAKKIQPLGTSTTHCMQTEYRKHMAKEEDPSTRNILESGSS